MMLETFTLRFSKSSSSMFNKSGNLSSLTSLTSYGDYLVIRKSNMICLWKPSHDIDIKQAV